MDYAAVSAVLARHIPQLAGAYLYGSQARGDARADSDVDIAVVSRAGRTPLEQQASARDALMGLLDRDVDITDLQDASLFLARQVFEDGLRICAPDATYLDFFEVRTMRDYVDLKERLAPIEADILARGRVLGGTAP